MANIGTFTTDKDGFTGTLRTLTLNVKVKLVPNDKGSSENAPAAPCGAGLEAWRGSSIAMPGGMSVNRPS